MREWRVTRTEISQADLDLFHQMFGFKNSKAPENSGASL
jgi:hypothetical protein